VSSLLEPVQNRATNFIERVPLSAGGSRRIRVAPAPKKDWTLIESPSIFRPSLPALRVDGKLIEQVIDNLIDNAIKYAPAGSEIRIAATSQNSQVEITVADTDRVSKA